MTGTLFVLILLASGNSAIARTGSPLAVSDVLQATDSLRMPSAGCNIVQLLVETMSTSANSTPQQIPEMLRKTQFKEIAPGIFKSNFGDCTATFAPSGLITLSMSPPQAARISSAVLTSLTERAQQITANTDFSLSLMMPAQTLDGGLRLMDEIIVVGESWIALKKHYLPAEKK